MIGRFWFYRRRRVLPFLAVYCLVCINGATLVPFVPPAPQARDAPTRAGNVDTGDHGDSWYRARYERGHDRPEPESVVAGGLPPIVKNLRRPVPSRHFKAASRNAGLCPPGVRGPMVESVQRVLAGNAADLTRLCRLLL